MSLPPHTLKMATPQVIGNYHYLETQCLEFTQALVNQKIGFNIQLTSGSFSFSFDNIGKRTIAPTRTPTEVKRKSPSTIRRNARRRRKFLENKKYQSSSVGSEKPDHVESSQSYSESTSVPSSVSTDIIYNDPGDGFTKESEGVQKVPPLKILVNNPSSPIYRIQQVDGACCLSDEDEDGELSLCDKNQSSKHGDDPKMGQSANCPNCDQPFSLLHQCQDNENQTNIDTINPIESHSQEPGIEGMPDYIKALINLFPSDAKLHQELILQGEKFNSALRAQRDYKSTH